ncbi:STAS domain-containing protein [Streptomyces sp. DSM 44915]|uniref:STAS domain-containing protein n=1 Tax=Streptomyces chisholmiae TaxID=3075540 RepID=A0ABU2JZD8_9ACTN|nr:STAS domain-containing protein [Streptomyces sp. DSM 44915]MDT0270320.1 STAS domain-containing protein [Streptomyces sp. DSM 44915]
MSSSATDAPRPFDASVGAVGSSTVLRLSGDLTEADVPALRGLVDRAVAETADRAARRLVIDVHELGSMAPAGLRCLAFAQQHLPPTTEIAIDGASPSFHAALDRGRLTQSMTVITATA